MRTLLLLTAVFALASSSYLQTSELVQLLKDTNQRVSLNIPKTTADRIAEHGYPVEKHHAVTEDGYILGLFRIPYSHKLQNQNSYRPVVLIQHGLFSSSDGWVLNGPNDALPFVLSDAGFDVFLGNARGNTYSRNHTKWTTKHPKFWDFSWHELGIYDLPAVIDTILEINGQNQKAIHYVGHSQGTTSFMVMLSMRPEYNAKIKVAHMLAPVAFMSNLVDYLVVTFSPYLGYPDTKYTAFFDKQEFLPSNRAFVILGYTACEEKYIRLELCNQGAYILHGAVPGRSNITAIEGALGALPAGASTNQICHYMQEHNSGHFRQYDHGVKKNKLKYGQETPPDYPVHLISSKLHLWYGDNDELAAVVDVLQLADLLPNKVMHHIEDPLWSHGDFVMNMLVRKTINDPIVQLFKDYEQQAIQN